jgi:hypothetical protein
MSPPREHKADRARMLESTEGFGFLLRPGDVMPVRKNSKS